jgi:predicted nuclease of predicted toxin-antitoxin system
MKLLFDENLSHRLVKLLMAEFPGSEHVRNVSLKSAADILIWEYARQNDFAILSKDIDFEQRALLHGHPPKVVWVRLGNCSTAEVESLLKTRLVDLLKFEADPQASFLAVS